MQHAMLVVRAIEHISYMGHRNLGYGSITMVGTVELLF